MPVSRMNKSDDKNFNLKKASKNAKKMIKAISKISKKNETVLSVIILAVGISLGIVFDEFALFLSISVAIDIVFNIVVNEKE